ncbi:zinc ribbon domain-containing protein [Candidatus Bathyarchaeota archaeon]|nr:MAG: zinc ribbon domain-containing protein [Candidatus Bathyarchaeota archaeon]
MKCPVCHGELQTSDSFCPYCGTRLNSTSSGRQGSAPARHVGTAVGLIALIVLGGLFASGVLVPAATRFYDDARNILRNLACLSPALCTNSTFPTTSGKATYDQQVSLIFTQDFYSLSFNVTAVPQTDSSGFGPAYLLNGLSDSGYWYQVGLAYNWPLASGTSYDSGFHFIWEVFYPNGTTNNPVLSRIPDNVNQGDIVGLSLSFPPGTNSVTMLAKDYNTAVSSSHSYTAGGGSIFKGSSSSRATRTPTSLMTEWYHASPSETSMKQVTYSKPNAPISSAWICIREYAPSNPNSSVFGQCSSELLLGSQTRQYSYHGLIAYANQNMFQTGPS